MTKPLKYRKLHADMKIKELTVSKVARRAGINLSIASQLLNGRLIDPLKLKKLIAVIERSPIPPDPATA
jgi:hypothetical protein